MASDRVLCPFAELDYNDGEITPTRAQRDLGYGRVRRMEGAYAGGGARGGHWLAECAAEA
ncbi:Chorismate synthase [Gossypium arboreum]|uniref:Chorismate synthase n=1 Tax=Gossypium arboreum TaxID=29729 RepID=A0A0B0MZ29_GOSAR|nr:Chorismate synthase [Gossypium arboreum]